MCKIGFLLCCRGRDLHVWR